MRHGCTYNTIKLLRHSPASVEMFPITYDCLHDYLRNRFAIKIFKRAEIGGTGHYVVSAKQLTMVLYSKIPSALNLRSNLRNKILVSLKRITFASTRVPDIPDLFSSSVSAYA